ncbi:helix-turn-helix domain-containing protein [Mycobacterium simiae]|uniref:helix-turn-helix domain-containing protein n=1 Tax=Mycobacterium simiae TaxID=1784 RepID=UPI00041E12FE
MARCDADLVASDDPIGDIAARWGFVSLPHFSRVFTKQYRCAPRLGPPLPVICSRGWAIEDARIVNRGCPEST